MTRDLADRLGITSALRAVEDVRETGILGRAMRDLDSQRLVQKAIDDANSAQTLSDAIGRDSLIEAAMRAQDARNAALGSSSAIEAAMRAQDARNAALGSSSAIEAAMRAQDARNAVLGSSSAIEAAMRAQDAINAATSSVRSALERASGAYLSAPDEIRSPDASRPAPKREPLASPADLGQLVRARRRSQGLSQQDLADVAGTGRRFISELETGKPTLELGKALQVCTALGLNLFAAPR